MRSLGLACPVLAAPMADLLARQIAEVREQVIR
jgi:hypothetical protein